MFVSRLEMGPGSGQKMNQQKDNRVRMQGGGVRRQVVCRNEITAELYFTGALDSKAHTCKNYSQNCP